MDLTNCGDVGVEVSNGEFGDVMGYDEGHGSSANNGGKQRRERPW